MSEPEAMGPEPQPAASEAERGVSADARRAGREQILARFAAWLDQVLDAEDPPQGLDAQFLAELAGAEEEGRAEPAEAQGDLYSMWAALTALTQEVKLQGRAFRQLDQTLAPVAELGVAVRDELADLQAALALALAGRAEGEREARRQAQREAVGLLADLHDRLERGLGAARRSLAELERPVPPAKGWFARPPAFPAHAVEVARALAEGYALSLERLREGLEQLGVQRLGRVGEPFDPEVMRAADVEETTAAAEGTVLEVYRTGYTWRGELFRPAEVRVARAPGINQAEMEG